MQIAQPRLDMMVVAKNHSDAISPRVTKMPYTANQRVMIRSTTPTKTRAARLEKALNSPLPLGCDNDSRLSDAETVRELTE